MTNKTSIFLRAAALCIVHCALCIPFSASAVTITATATSVGAGDPTPVTATVSNGTVNQLYLVYQIVGSPYAWNTNEMTSVSADVYTSSIPPLSGAVNVSWYVTDGTVSSATTTSTLAAVPDYNRYHDGAQYNATTAPYGWQQVSGSNYVAQTPNGGQWKASGVGISIRNAAGAIYTDADTGIDFPVMYFYNLPPSEEPFIQSPKLYGGVGTIDIRTKLLGSIDTTELTIQVAKTDGEPEEQDWISVGTYTYGGVNVCKIIHIVLNDYGVTYVRALRTGHNIYSVTLTSGRFAIDNFCITKPAADVGIIEKLKNPGYPSSDQNILMRCAVTNVCEDTPAINRRVSVKYQYVARDTYSPVASAYAWSSADMAYMGKDANGLDWYEGMIPTQRVGYVWYYYQVDYDGYHYGDNPLTGTTESLSPAYWDAGADTHVRPVSGTKFQVRPYRSRYGRVAIEAFPAEASIPEMTLVDNEQWLAVVPVSGLTVISNYFVGYGYYVDDAEAYEADAVIWGENNPDALSDPTLAGFLESTHDTTVTNRLVALNEKKYKGYYLYRFSSNDLDEEAAQSQEGDRRYDYIVKKAVYQDFDDWTASPEYYESSLGGLPTLTFTENFDGNAASAQSGAICVTDPWAEDGYAPGDSKDEDFQDDTLSDEFSTAEIRTPGRFIRRGSRVLADRKAKNTDLRVNKTMALTLNGQIENTKDSLPYGLEKITFKARASVDDSNFALYTKGTSWALPSNGNQIFVNATWALGQMAPSKPYLSYIFLYQPPSFDDGASWYEVRIIQTDSADANNNTVRVELWRRDPTATASVFVSGTAASQKYYLNSSRSVNVRAYNESNKFCAQVSFTGNTTYQATVKETTANAARLTAGGTVGFGVFDAVPNISAVKVGSSNGGTDLISNLANTWSDWSHGGRRPDGQYRWTVTSGSITRAVPAQTIGLYAANCVGSESTAEVDEIPLTPTFTRSVNTLTMQDFTIDFKAWNKKFVQLRYMDGDGGVVLDDIVYFPWRAATRYNSEEAEVNNVNYRDWTTRNQQEEWLDRVLGTPEETMRQHWAVFEGWTVENAGGFHIGVNFDRTRANTNLVQGVVSPELENGLGSCSFSYTASGGKVVYGIERSDESNIHTWTPVAVYMNNSGESGERYAKIGVNYGVGNSGRIRVRIYGPQDVEGLAEDYPDCGYDPNWGYTDATAKLMLDNLRVKDYPQDLDDNAWNAYNLLITGDAPDGQVYNNSGKSCFFNNSPTDGVYGIEEFNEDDPFLESPPLSGVGVGEIAFQYRLVPGTGSGNGTLVIKVAPDRDTPLAEWKTITNLVVSANGTAFVKFDNDKIFDEHNYVVRFYNSKIPGTPRIVIDNVLVTAPARPSFEFEYVALLPVQPLSGTNTVVEAKIMREIMKPKHIKVYVSYHKYDTNNVNDTWGIANWFNPLDRSSRVELALVDEKVYRSPEGGGIPAFDVNDVVEYVVWGVHDDINLNAGDSPIVQGEETFVVPAWYRTVDLEEQVFVPMDINVTTNALWNNVYNRSGGWSPYFWVFSCPPGTFFVNEINHWRNDGADCDKGSAEYVEFAGYAGTDLGGWKLSIVRNENLDDIEYDVPYGTRVRPNGPNGWGFFVWGDSCAASSFVVDEGGQYEWTHTPFHVDASFPNSSDRDDRHIGTYAGIIIYRPNGMVEEMVRFGTKNVGAFTGEEDLWEYAGRKDNKSPNSISRISKEDEHDDLVAGRVASDFDWKVVEQTPVTVNGINQVFADLDAGDTPVVVALYDPAGNEITDEDILAWIEHYGGEQSDIDALGTMEKFNEEFLLNLDLTKACVAELKITSIVIEDGVVYLRVRLTRTEDNTAVGTRRINGTLKLLGRADLSTGTFAPIQPDAFDSNFSTGNTIGIEYELPASNPPAFCKVIVE